MGLDGVELVLATEERFGIEITDEEAEAVRTVGDLIELVSSKLAVVNEQTCFTRKAFYLLRRTLMRVTGAPRSTIRPTTEIQALVENDTKQFWKALQKQLAAPKWPQLEYPASISFSIGTAAVAVFVGMLWAWEKVIGSWTLFLGLIPALAASVFFAEQLMRMTGTFRTELPDSRQTVGQLANFIVDCNPELISVPESRWTQERVRLVVKEVISNQLALPLESLHDNASFVRDLGLD